MEKETEREKILQINEKKIEEPIKKNGQKIGQPLHQRRFPNGQ